MTIAQGLLAEFEQELIVTQACLARIPEDKLDWRPHAKSMSLGALGLHIATLGQGVLGLALPDSAELPSFGAGFPQATSVAQIAAAMDETAQFVRRELGALGDERLLATWRLSKDGAEVAAMPRIAFIRAILLNHWYHHRGQLSVYLRLLDVPVPAIYGPSADESPFG